MQLGDFDGPRPKAWNVMFLDRDEPMFWFDHLFTRQKFRHVCAYGYVPEWAVWVVVDPSMGCMSTYVLDPDQLAEWYRLRADRVTAMFTHVIGDAPRYRGKLFASCVSAVCHLIGVDAPVFTPYGLYKHLTKHPNAEKKIDNYFGR